MHHSTTAIDQIGHDFTKIFSEISHQITSKYGKNKEAVHLMHAGHSNPDAVAQTCPSRSEHHNKFLASDNGMVGYYGIDVSHWQNHIDWSTVRSDTIPHRLKFFIVKATQGINHVDEYFKSNFKNLKSNQNIVGAYHFYIYHHDPFAQAKNYINNVKLKSGDIKPIVDVELDCSNCTKPGIGKQELITNLSIFLKEIETHFKTKPIIYTYSCFYNTYLKGHFNDYPVWLSHFSLIPPLGLDHNLNSENNSVLPKISIWQFSNNEKIKGVIGRVDMNFIPQHELDVLRMK